MKAVRLVILLFLLPNFCLGQSTDSISSRHVVHSICINYARNIYVMTSRKSLIDENFDNFSNYGFEVWFHTNRKILVNLGLKVRFDSYSIEVPPFQVTNTKVLQDFFLPTLSVGILNQIEFLGWEINYGIGISPGMVFPAGIGIKYSMINPVQVAYDSDFLSKNPGFQCGVSGLVCFDYYLFYNLSFRAELRANYELFQRYPISPIRINFNDVKIEKQVLPRRFHSFISLGLAYNFKKH
jgi:hypothetical protein